MTSPRSIVAHREGSLVAFAYLEPPPRAFGGLSEGLYAAEWFNAETRTWRFYPVVSPKDREEIILHPENTLLRLAASNRLDRLERVQLNVFLWEQWFPVASYECQTEEVIWPRSRT